MMVLIGDKFAVRADEILGFRIDGSSVVVEIASAATPVPFGSEEEAVDAMIDAVNQCNVLLVGISEAHVAAGLDMPIARTSIELSGGEIAAGPIAALSEAVYGLLRKAGLSDEAIAKVVDEDEAELADKSATPQP
jgi:hypothetical protein